MKYIDQYTELLHAGLSVVPFYYNGDSFTPILKEYSHTSAPDVNLVMARIKERGEVDGFAVICGDLSNNFIGIDFDVKNDPTGVVWDEFKEIVSTEMPDLWAKLPKVSTRSKTGRHVLFYYPLAGRKRVLARHSEIVRKDQKIPDTIIELQAAGSMINVPPSSGYEFLSGDIYSAPMLTDYEYNFLIEACVSLNRYVKPEHDYEYSKRVISSEESFDERPSAAYAADEQAFFQDLIDAGWKIEKTFGQQVRWTRPGKQTGTSATWNYVKGRFFVFSSNTDLEPYKALTPFAVYAFLYHGGDFSAAARALVDRGYGRRREIKLPSKSGQKEHKESLSVYEQEVEEENRALKISRMIEALVKEDEQEQLDGNVFENCPLIEDRMYDLLPRFFDSFKKLKGRNRDMSFLTALPIIATAAKGLYIDYGDIERASLYVFIVANAGTGKGPVKHTAQLAHDLHEQRREQYKAQVLDWERRKLQAKEDKKEFLEAKPPELKFIVAADSSDAALRKDLTYNKTGVIIIETEADTLSKRWGSDWGSYSDIARAAYHGERISSNRAEKDQEEVENACFSLALTGTPDQVARVMGDTGNGLISRFCMYRSNEVFKFQNPLRKRGVKEFKADMKAKSKTVTQMHFAPETVVTFTDEQADVIDEMGETYEKQLHIFGQEAAQIITRSFTQMMRIIGIIAFVRAFDEGHRFGGKLTPNEDDFLAGILIFDVLIWNNLRFYAEISSMDKQKARGKTQKAKLNLELYDMFPDIFETRAGGIELLSEETAMSESAIRKYVRMWKDGGLLVCEEKGVYRKPNAPAKGVYMNLRTKEIVKRPKPNDVL